LANDGSICPKCGRKKILVQPADGKGSGILRCEDCDTVDPLKSARAEGWVKSSLHPPV